MLAELHEMFSLAIVGDFIGDGSSGPIVGHERPPVGATTFPATKRAVATNTADADESVTRLMHGSLLFARDCCWFNPYLLVANSLDIGARYRTPNLRLDCHAAQTANDGSGSDTARIGFAETRRRRNDSLQTIHEEESSDGRHFQTFRDADRGV
jgi:hypothetical protein